MNTDRKVKRVLVMVDYGESDPDSGEVFDLTALVLETSEKAEHYQSSINLEVNTRPDYDAPREEGKSRWPVKITIQWSAMINYNSSGRTGSLDDAINASMPDSFTTQEMRKKLKKLNSRAEKLQSDIQMQRLLDASKIRSQHPIARVAAPEMRQIPQQSESL